MPSKTAAFLLNRLRELREAHDLTQEAFAEVAGMSYKYYQAIEGGRKADLRFSTLGRLADAYGIEIWELLAPPIPKTKLARNAKRKRPDDRKKTAPPRS